VPHDSQDAAGPERRPQKPIRGQINALVDTLV
jgi:hypothetical protein